MKAILSLLGLPPDRTAALLTANPAKVRLVLCVCLHIRCELVAFRVQVVASARARRRLPVTVIPALPAATVTATKPPPAPTATGAKPLQPAAAAKRLTTATVTAEPMSTPTVPLTQAVGGSADEARVKPTRAGASWTMAIPPNAPAAHKVQPIPATGPAAADDTRNQKRKEMKQEKKRRGAETSTPPPPLKRSNASMG